MFQKRCPLTWQNKERRGIFRSCPSLLLLRLRDCSSLLPLWTLLMMGTGAH